MEKYIGYLTMCTTPLTFPNRSYKYQYTVRWVHIAENLLWRSCRWNRIFYTLCQSNTHENPLVQWLIIRVVGSTPLPIVFGKVLDVSCVTWGIQCGECGSCHVYDNHVMATLMASLCLVLKVIILDHIAGSVGAILLNRNLFFYRLSMFYC